MAEPEQYMGAHVLEATGKILFFVAKLGLAQLVGCGLPLTHTVVDTDRATFRWQRQQLFLSPDAG